MQLADLVLVAEWLSAPAVARWYLVGSTLDDQVADLRGAILGVEPTEVLLAVEDGRPIGWCQWYLCGDYPEHAAGVQAGPNDVGIDYAIGDPARHGHGVGTILLAALIAHIRQRHPHAAIVADPQASNVASRRVLEKNGFSLVAQRPVASEPSAEPMAIYRLDPAHK